MTRRVKQAPLPSLRRIAPLLFLVGATYGVLLDRLHVLSGTTRYAGTDGQPPWVPLLFGGAAVLLGATRLVLGRQLEDAPRPISGGLTLGALGLFGVAYAISAYLPGTVALGLLVVLGLAMLHGLDRSVAGGATALAAMVAGPLVEIGLSAVGAFRYVDAPGPGFVLGVPHWLPFLYLCAAAAVGAVARWRGRG